ncbi:MAG: disulfide bond formation protein DsbA [Rhodobiaceae bacterium]|nr:MAG: disulfide bond formation protein DsbA [Rhodobiaceae bacterium]
MAKTVDFIFDFGSPNGYLCHKVIPEIEARTGATFNYVPALLGGIHKLTNNQPPMIAFGEVKGKLAYEQLETARFVTRHKLDAYRFNPHFPVITLLIMRGLIAAEMDGQKMPYIEVVLKAMWEDGLKMDDPDVVAKALADGGLNAERLIGRTQEKDVKQKLIDNTSETVARGVFGIPTFFLGDEMFFGKERLSQLEEAIVG